MGRIYLFQVPLVDFTSDDDDYESPAYHELKCLEQAG